VGPIKRRTTIIEGPLAYAARRLQAARLNDVGIQIFTLPALAARLAGGFLRPARSQELDSAIRTALNMGAFEDIQGARELPGMARAVARSLNKLWQADADLVAAAKDHGRIRDLLAIQKSVRETLPAGVLTLRDLRDAAQSEVCRAGNLLGDIEIDLRKNIVPLWQPLIKALAREVRTVWRAPAEVIPWFDGETIEAVIAPSRPTPARISCANPRSEVIEALRWMRELLAGGVPAKDIAVCAASDEAWDEHMDALGSESGLPIHFSHGRSALATFDGQACAALADVLVQGLNQRRVRRLIRYIRDSKSLLDLPNNWARGLKRDAPLLTVQHWQSAFDDLASAGEHEIYPGPIVMPVISIISRGPDAAEEAGSLLLGKRAAALWVEALRKAPARALLLSLEELRLPDRRDPGSSVVWCPAHHLVEAPRSHVLMLGLNARSWPRRGGEDPILPSHIISGGMLDPTWTTQQDRENFRIILERASIACVLSSSRRDAQGKSLPVSSLSAQIAGPDLTLKRMRVPVHAFSEGDRLFARPSEATAAPRISSPMRCWHNRLSRELTAHDGLLTADHPVIFKALSRVQSATSLRSLLRDPLGFVWRYGLRWTAPTLDDQPLSLDPRVYGELVHDILKYAVAALEPSPGFRQAKTQEVHAAVEHAQLQVRGRWPLDKPVPPRMLWDNTLKLAGDLAIAALTLDPPITSGSQSWPEALFGQTPVDSSQDDLPWSINIPVPIPGTSLKVGGKIDRLDIRIDEKRRAAQVTDYKTGQVPQSAIVLDGGRELQRVTYILAVKHLRPDITAWQARLVFLSTDGTVALRLENIEVAISALSRNASVATSLLEKGVALAGEDAEGETYDLRLAHPAGRRVYFARKRPAINAALGVSFVETWHCP
jgi:hypothetical protein